jgi:uncharacterized protein DUF6515
MRYRAILTLAVVLSPLTARAQFLGDAMAAAGFAETADDPAAAGIAILAISGGMQAPPTQVGGPGMSKNISSPQYSANVSAQPNSVYYPPGTAQPAPATAQQPMPQNAPMPMSTPMPSPQPYVAPGAGAGFSGSGRVYTPEEVSEWKAGYAPVGLKFDAPPPGAETVSGNWGDFKYFKGVFYKPEGKKWVVVPAPVGARVKERPAAGSGILYNNVAYTYYNGTFYLWNREVSAADVVAPPVGATVTYIPDTAVKTERDGKPCYVYGNTCFRPGFRGQNVVYTVS